MLCAKRPLTKVPIAPETPRRRSCSNLQGNQGGRNATPALGLWSWSLGATTSVSFLLTALFFFFFLGVRANFDGPPQLAAAVPSSAMYVEKSGRFANARSGRSTDSLIAPTPSSTVTPELVGSARPTAQISSSVRDKTWSRTTSVRIDPGDTAPGGTAARSVTTRCRISSLNVSDAGLWPVVVVAITV